jgi:hypothetical protein
MTIAGDRYSRASIRIALRQMKAEAPASATLTAWLAHFDQDGPEGGDDDASLHHDGRFRPITRLFGPKRAPFEGGYMVYRAQIARRYSS